jgi:hypothetical protein
MSQNPQPPFAASPAGGPRAIPEIVQARSIAPSDNSTSVVIASPGGPQIQAGAVGVTAHTDVVYATRADAEGRDLPLRLDLLVPETPGAKPLVVYLPGGGFVFSAKEAALARRAYVAEAGYAVASTEYRTVRHGATYRDAVADAKSAIRFLRAHGAQYGLDTSRVAVWGESADGYVASMAGVTNAVAEFETPDNPGFSSDVQAVINQFGLSNLLKFTADFDPETRQALLRPGTPSGGVHLRPGHQPVTGGQPRSRRRRPHQVRHRRDTPVPALPRQRRQRSTPQPVSAAAHRPARARYGKHPVRADLR